MKSPLFLFSGVVAVGDGNGPSDEEASTTPWEKSK